MHHMNPNLFGVPVITPRKIKKTRRPQIYVNDEMRFEILILITEFGLSCYQAARVLKLPYTNAKVIYRVFRENKRITSNARARRKGFHEEYLLKHAHLIR